MDTSGRAILLAGTTVTIALLGMFATGVSFLYGLAIASVFAVLMTMLALADGAPRDAVEVRGPDRPSAHAPSAAVRSSWRGAGRGRRGCRWR